MIREWNDVYPCGVLPSFQPALQGFHPSLAVADITLRESLHFLKERRGWVMRAAIPNQTKPIIGGNVPEGPKND
jgi:hypothetical protein